MAQAGKLGRLPKKDDPRNLKLAKYMVVSTPPSTLDNLEKVPTWGMMLNDSLGDCTSAGKGHLIQEWTYDASGAEITPPDSAILTSYEKDSGYIPGNENTDNGASCTDALNNFKKIGVGGHKIAAYAEINVANHAEVQEAINIFGAVYIGFNFPNSAMTQFNDGQNWTVVPDDGGLDGGHCVIAGNYDSSLVGVITWGARTWMTWEFWDKYVEEAYAVVSSDWTVNGKSPEGLDLAQLQIDLAAIAANEPNPAPVPEPTPTPVPPVPTPTPTPPVPTPVPVPPVPTPTPVPPAPPVPVPVPPVPTPEPTPQPVPDGLLKELHHLFSEIVATIEKYL